MGKQISLSSVFPHSRV